MGATATTTSSGGARVSLPDLKNLMDKQLLLSLNGKRQVSGVLRGYDAFMNIVLDDSFEHTDHTFSEGDEGKKALGLIVIRGNSIVSLETMERF